MVSMIFGTAALVVDRSTEESSASSVPFSSIPTGTRGSIAVSSRALQNYYNNNDGRVYQNYDEYLRFQMAQRSFSFTGCSTVSSKLQFRLRDISHLSHVQNKPQDGLRRFQWRLHSVHVIIWGNIFGILGESDLPRSQLCPFPVCEAPRIRRSTVLQSKSEVRQWKWE